MEPRPPSAQHRLLHSTCHFTQIGAAHGTAPTCTACTACCRRYTAFIFLYPVGVVGEMWSVYQALPLIKQRRLRSLSMPNAANLAFDYHTFLAVSEPRS